MSTMRICNKKKRRRKWSYPLGNFHIAFTGRFEVVARNRQIKARFVRLDTVPLSPKHLSLSSGIFPNIRAFPIRQNVLRGNVKVVDANYYETEVLLLQRVTRNMVESS